MALTYIVGAPLVRVHVVQVVLGHVPQLAEAVLEELLVAVGHRQRGAEVLDLIGEHRVNVGHLQRRTGHN